MSPAPRPRWTGSGNATNVVIVDTIDPDTTYVNATPAPTNITGDVLTWFIGTVEGGESVSITLIVKVDAFLGDGEVMRNNVTLNYADANGNPYDEESDYVDVVCTAPVMTITKTVDKDKADPGDTLVYTIVYENEGSGNATNVVIEDTLPADTTFVSATPSGYVKVGDTLTWTFALVEGNSNGTITITVTVDAGVADGTILRNNVTLNYEDQNGNEQGEEGDSTETVVTRACRRQTRTTQSFTH
jgi:uncharacterized repeat protein (TIGR01451 family)